MRTLIPTAIRIFEQFPEFTEPTPTKNEVAQLQRWMAEMRQKGINLESHIRLFLYEFLEHIGRDYDALLQRFAGSGDKKATLNLWFREANEQALAFGKDEAQAYQIAERTVQTDLFKFISYSSDPESLPNLLFIIARCRKTDPLAYEELHLNNAQNIDFYVRLFCGPDKYKVDRIRAVLEPKHLIPYFAGRNIDEYDPLLARIRYIYDPEDPEKREIEAAACLFIRGLVHCIDSRKSSRQHGDWYYDFLEGLKSNPDCCMIPRFIDPDYQNDLDEWKSRKLVQNPLDERALADLVLDNERMPSEPRDQREFARYRITEVEGYEPSECQLRPYQNELVTQAINGKNTIICAPTGSGKTQVAVHVIRKHLMQRHQDGKVGRCVMLVPTVPLVDQQAQQLTQYLMELKDEYRPDLGYWIEAFSGCDNSTEGRAFRLLAADICVMTPQILINMMNSVLRSERIYLADFTLFVFDECHHCDKQHPYKMLMDSLEDRLNQLAERPQIVGLTASMGVGDTSWDMRACREHMLKLCSNMMAETISTVRHQMDDLRSYVMPPVDEVISVKRPANNAFVDNIDRVMEKIEQRLHSSLRELVEKKLLQLNMEEITFPPHAQQGRYQTMVGVLKKHVQLVPDSTLRFLLVRSIDHLAHYFHTILISDLLPNSYALDYLQGKMANYEMKTGKDELELINNRLLDTYKELHKKLANHVQQEKLQQKQILVHLHRILAEQFSREPDSRCLIFVATRNCAQKLSDHLNNVPELPNFYGKRNVGFMVSSNQSGIAGGQSSQDQQNMRRDFDSGKIKVLVVTSVAEEGVNITACNLIVKYNNVGSERSMIQRRGRARQKNSRSILLALDIGVEQVEYINMQKEAMMMRCIQDLQEKSEAALKKEIATKRAQMAALKEMQRRNLEAKRQMMQAKRYKLCCKSCGNLICRSTFIRTVADSLFVVCDEAVWKRSKIDLRDKPTKDQLSTKCARWMCKTCPGMEWGAVVKYSNCYLPQLAAGVFTLEREDQHEVQDFNAGSRRTWTLVQDQFFNVDPIGPTNIRDMYIALMRAMPELIKQMDQRESLANLKYMEKMAGKKNEPKTKTQQLFLEE